MKFQVCFIIFLCVQDVYLQNFFNHIKIRNTMVPDFLKRKHILVHYDVPDDCRYEIISENEINLTCCLKTINSEFESTNFSVIPSEFTVELNILCNDEISTKSYLKQGSFKHLSRLKVLTIKFCKFSSFFPGIFNGLKNLKKLAIHTNNNHIQNFNMHIERESFLEIKNLEVLDISKNNIWSIPEKLFCNMNKLYILNISNNHIQDINELAFRNFNISDEKKNLKLSPDSLCFLDLDTLDISYNNFAFLPSSSFGRLKILTKLYINNNGIKMIEDKALNGMKKLSVLNLSSNRIVAIPSELFLDCLESLKEVHLHNNSISIISSKLFANLVYLQVLDLSLNQIKSVFHDENIFKGLIRLVLLDLSNNKITELYTECFSDLYSLQILNLRHNRIEIIRANSFSFLNNLHTLLLSYNSLTYINAYSLNGLYVLSLLSLDNNQLTDIHEEAFKNCSSLQDISLNVNSLKKIPVGLRNLRILKTIDLGENYIYTVQSTSFVGLNHLYGLRLIGNLLQKVTANMFDNMPNLQILNLANNKISDVDANSFKFLSSIQAIRLDGNNIKNISRVFLEISSLLWLNISDNNLEIFDLSLMPQNLQWLDIHKNNIIELYYSKISHKLCLQTLDASFNKLSKITGNSLPNSLELLFLNDNIITDIEPNTFMGKCNLSRVDLYANKIQTLDIKSLRILPVAHDKLLPEFYIGDNPFSCDCNIEWLQKMNFMGSRQYPTIMDIEFIYCKLLHSRQKNFVSLVNATPKNFLCAYKTHCFALCHCCEFDACDCEMTCPTNCTCFHDESWSINIVECSSANYIEIPSNIPMDTTEVYIDGNSISELSGHSFIGRKNLITLYANSSRIQIIYNTTFTGLKNLLVLHLEWNKINELSGFEFSNLNSLRELFLHNNEIIWISNNTFINLKQLQILRLDSNKLKHFDIWQLTRNSYLHQIGLSGNMWSCECGFLIHFRNFLQLYTEKITDASQVACIYNNMSTVMKEKNGTKCTLREGTLSNLSVSKIEYFLPILLVGICAFICICTFLFGIFCYRNELRIFVRSNCLFNFFLKSTAKLDNSQREKMYDAYLGYSLQDERFVKQTLAETLEKDIGYKIKLHYRDLNLNLYITDAIVQTVENSKQAVFVLSKNFLYNEWMRFEYKSALHEIINKQIKIIFILYGELPKKDIDLDMRHYLKTNTCIEWNDKRFWEKLRTALPHPRKTLTAKSISVSNIYNLRNMRHSENVENLTTQFSWENSCNINNSANKCKSNAKNSCYKYKSVQNSKSFENNKSKPNLHPELSPNYVAAHVPFYSFNPNNTVKKEDYCEYVYTSNFCSLLKPDNHTQHDKHEDRSELNSPLCKLAMSDKCNTSEINTCISDYSSISYK